MTQSIISYKVFLNSANWHWEVQSRGKIVDFGVAPSHVMARVEAMVAAMSHRPVAQRGPPQLVKAW
jgi:hypothetical protein